MRILRRQVMEHTVIRTVFILLRFRVLIHNLCKRYCGAQIGLLSKRELRSSFPNFICINHSNLILRRDGVLLFGLCSDSSLSEVLCLFDSLKVSFLPYLKHLIFESLQTLRLDSSLFKSPIIDGFTDILSR